MKPTACYALPLLVAAAALAAPDAPSFQPQPHDWPQWRGPERTGASAQTGLLKSWPREGPPLVWKARHLGLGYSAPSVAAGRVFTLGNYGENEYAVALDDRTGKELWSTVIGPVRSGGGGYPGPRSTPTVDGDLLYALGLNGDLVCLSVATGKKHWQCNLVRDFGGSPGTWGYSESPLVDGDKVICTPGGSSATLVALDKRTGKPLWKSRGAEGDSAAHASAVIAELWGQRQYVQFVSSGLIAVAADSGRPVWTYSRPANSTANCATPIVSDGCVFATSSYGAGGGLVRFSGKGVKGDLKEVYFTRSMQNHHGGVVLAGGYLYGATDPGLLVCLEFATGQVMWRERRPGKGSTAVADGRLYHRHEEGPVLLIEANPKGYVECGYLSPPQQSGSPTWPHPVIANGRLYLRDQDMLWCYDVKQC